MHTEPIASHISAGAMIIFRESSHSNPGDSRNRVMLRQLFLSYKGPLG
jgi:hypothetical protein